MTHVLVVGHGMAGTRFVQELRARDPEHRLTVTVVGAEPDMAYNRVLLSSVLAGSLGPADVGMVPAAWYPEAGIDLRLGIQVEHIDRRRRWVLTGQGEHIGYDHLVLATGSRPWVPPIDGLTDGDELDRDVAVFRTLRDCRDIIARLPGVRRAVVLGGGLLGLEAARGLAGRGVDVEVVHAVDRLMERQLDAEAGTVLIRTLRSLGIHVRLGARVRAFDELAGQRVLVLDDGTRIAADLVVVACGVRPNTALARAAGLDVGRAIVVDERMTSVSDPCVHAIGECAQHDGQVYGLVAPAWEQARVLASVLTGGDATYHGSPLVTRLKAADIDLAAMGDPDLDGATGHQGSARSTGEEPEVIRFTDPARGTYQKIVIRDDKIAGAIMLGGIETVGTVTQLFDRAGVVPADRRALIFPGVAGGGAVVADPASLGDDAQVCRCNGVTAGEIRRSCTRGARTVGEVAMSTRATTGCGSCRDQVSAIVGSAARTMPGAGDDDTDDDLVLPDRPDDVDVELAEVPA